MLGFIVRRLAAMALVLAITSLLTFTLFFKGPTNPASSLCEERPPCTPAKMAAIEHSMGLDEGLFTNYGRFVKGLVKDRVIDQGEVFTCDAPCFGISFHTRQEVTKEFLARYPATVSLALGAAVLFLIGGCAAGVIAARYRGSTLDRFLVSSSLAVASVPYYIFALIAWIFLTQQWSVFPQTGYTALSDSPFEWAKGLLLPWIVLALAFAPTYVRYTRSYLVESLSEDYVRTAQAKGVSPRTVMFKHGMRAAMVPIVTIFALDLASLLSGTIFTEVIFGIDGVGRWTIESIRGSLDFPILSATVMLLAFFYIFANFIVDVTYGFLDPRVRIA